MQVAEHRAIGRTPGPPGRLHRAGEQGRAPPPPVPRDDPPFPDHEAEELSTYLRTGSGWILWCRRGVVLTSFVACSCMLHIGLFQMGIVRHLPEPPLPRMRADVVDAAASAYRPLGLPMPDAFLGLVSYAVTAALAVVGGADRHRTLWILPLALGVKVLVDAGQAARLSWLQWADHRAFCFWCLLAAAATFASVPLAAPEFVLACKRLFSG